MGGTFGPGLLLMGGTFGPGLWLMGGTFGPGLLLMGGTFGPGLWLMGGTFGPGLWLMGGTFGPGLLLMGGTFGPGLLLMGGTFGPGLWLMGGTFGPGRMIVLAEDVLVADELEEDERGLFSWTGRASDRDLVGDWRRSSALLTNPLAFLSASTLEANSARVRSMLAWWRCAASLLRCLRLGWMRFGPMMSGVIKVQVRTEMDVVDKEE
jgi:hypothetical protein